MLCILFPVLSLLLPLANVFLYEHAWFKFNLTGVICAGMGFCVSCSDNQHGCSAA
jgi:hypothetical protein